MAWGATLLTATGNQSNIVATVRFTNSVTAETFDRLVPGNDLTPYNLANFCATVITQLNQRDLLIGNLRLGPVALS